MKSRRPRVFLDHRAGRTCPVASDAAEQAPQYAIQDHVRWSSNSDGTVILDLRSGAYLLLRGLSSAFWSRIDACGRPPDDWSTKLPTPCESTDPASNVATFLQNLMDRGLIRPAQIRPIDSSAPREAASRPPTSRVPPKSSAIGARADELPVMTAGPLWTETFIAYFLLLTVTLATAVAPFRGLLGLVTFATRPVRRSPPWTHSILASRVHAVDRAASWYFKPVRCLQRSAATVLLMRLCGIPAELVVGARPVPFSAHAWVEVGGHVVNDDPRVQAYYLALERR